MGTLGSCVKKIAIVRFKPFPAGKPVKCEKIVRIAEGAVYALGPRGTVYTTGELSSKVHYVGTAEDYHAIKALIAFGIITKSEAFLHGNVRRKQDETIVNYRAVMVEVRRLEEAGIKLTKGQRAALERMRISIDVEKLPYYMQEKAKQKLGKV